MRITLVLNMDHGLTVNFIVELNSTLETRLDECAEGGLLWIGYLSNDIKPWDEIYQDTLDQINSNQLFERLVNTTESVRTMVTTSFISAS
ncbi:hypothetical protein RRG08_030907 [Elysia crispata]|uniref:Uncharacterized protein n=1 Tax=Elysia crispata TaxID=231223 RepID=A0AAE1AFD4_9GAST|nr:hypothetical protein RRG08_030907 [Elysia crispata]